MTEFEESEDEIVFTVLKHAEMDLASDAEILSSVDRLAARTLTTTSGEFKKWEQATGIIYQPHGLMNDQRLRNVVKPISQYCHG